MIFQIVAVFVTDTEFGYVRPEFETKKERTEYLETVARKNLFAIDGAAIEAGDKLLTLSTCCTLYGKNETGDQRLVVAAKLLPTAAEEAPYAVQDAKFPELPENVAGVIADCGFTSAKAEWKYISENNLRVPYDRRGKHVDALCRKRIELDSDAFTTLDAMKTCRLPILFIHGQADSFVPVEMTMQNYEACASPKRVLIVPGANHGMSYFLDREGYEAAVKAFFREQETGVDA